MNLGFAAQLFVSFFRPFNRHVFLSVSRKGSLTSRLTSEEMCTGTVLSQSKLPSVKNRDSVTDGTDIQSNFSHRLQSRHREKARDLPRIAPILFQKRIFFDIG